jgi:ParB-like chromosome segregation protein Spo0J
MENKAAGAVSLKVMAERKVAGIGKTTNFSVNPLIMEVEEGFNGRPLDPDHVRSIADAYKAGVILPALEVRVENGRVIVVDGHHRLAAAMLAISEGAEILSLDCRQFRGNDADRVMLMITSQQGLPMTPLQLGVQYRKLLGFGWSVAQIKEKGGRSTTHINQCIALAESNSDVQAMVTRKEVAAHTALKAVKKHGSNAGAVLSEGVQVARLAGKSRATEKHMEGGTPTKSLAAAIQMEIDSGGSFKAEDLCPRYASLIL